MSHSLTKIWLHIVFGTKNRRPLIKPSFERRLHLHIKEHLDHDLGCTVRAINGTADHVHTLLLLNPKHALMHVVQNIKGESSHLVNQGELSVERFAWQIGYGAFSVSESSMRRVERYIHNQKKHHHTETFAEEYQHFAKAHGLQFSTETVETVSG